MKMSLVVNLKEVRTHKGISQTKLAFLTGISRNQIQLIETGKSIPSVLTALLLADSMGVSVSDLFVLRDLSNS